MSFDIDANGIINVHAKDLGTGNEQKITITASTKLNKDEIDRMVKQAQEYSDQDKRTKEKIETKNKADNLAYSAEKSLKDMGDKIDTAQKQKIESAIKDLRESTKTEDEKDMQQKMEALSNILHELSAKMYQSNAPKGEQQPPPGNEDGQKKEKKREGGGDDDIIDAYYEVKN